MNKQRTDRRKKIGYVALLLAISIALFTGCMPGANQPTEAPEPPVTEQPPVLPPDTRPEVRVGTLRGPTGMGMAKLMQDSQNRETVGAYTFDIVGAPEDMVGKITTGEVDIAAIPINLAATLYQKSGDIQIAAVNTLGTLYIVDRSGTIGRIEDLAGRTIYAAGQGSTPEYVLQYILRENGLELGTDVTIEYKAEHAELAALLLSGDIEIALLPEPFVTTVASKNPNIQWAIDLTKMWEFTTNGESLLAMGCIVVNKAFAEENEELVQAFLEEYRAAVTYTNQNAKETAELIVQFGIMDNAKIAEAALPGCNITYIAGEPMVRNVNKFLEVLFEAEPRSIGGEMPDAAFYYYQE